MGGYFLFLNEKDSNNFVTVNTLITLQKLLSRANTHRLSHLGFGPLLFHDTFFAPKFYGLVVLPLPEIRNFSLTNGWRCFAGSLRLFRCVPTPRSCGVYPT